jgi:hypothetical protein
MSSPVDPNTHALVLFSNESYKQLQAERLLNYIFQRSLRTQFNDTYFLRAFPYRVLILTGRYPSPIFDDYCYTPFRGTMHELVRIIEPTVHSTIASFDYNGAQPILKLVESLERGMHFEQIDITADDENPASTCVGMSNALIESLKKTHGIESMFAAQKKEKTKAFCHAAVIIQCRDGYVLLDPSSRPESRIFSVPFLKTRIFGTKTLEADSANSLCPLFETGPEGEFEYYLKVFNADDIILKHFMMDEAFSPKQNSSFPIAVYNPDGSASKSIFISMLEKTITLKNMTHPKGHVNRTMVLYFHDLLNMKLYEKLKFFYDDGHPTFHLPFDELYQQINELIVKTEPLKSFIETVHVL